MARVTDEMYERIAVKFFARSLVAHRFSATNYRYWSYGLAERVGFGLLLPVVLAPDPAFGTFSDSPFSQMALSFQSRLNHGLPSDHTLPV